MSINNSFSGVSKNQQKVYDFKSVGVFMGSSKGVFPGTTTQNPIYEREAIRLGELIAQHNLRMVYGGGNAGLMGTISETVLNEGGKIHGTLSRCFVQTDSYIQQTHPNAVEDVVEGIETRKWLMIREADAFFGFPGGIGTYDELLEAAVEQYMRAYKGKPTISKPIILLNIEGRYEAFRRLIDDAIEHGFARDTVRNLYHYAESADHAMEILQSLQGQPRMALDEIGNFEATTTFVAKQRTLD